MVGGKGAVPWENRRPSAGNCQTFPYRTKGEANMGMTNTYSTNRVTGKILQCLFPLDIFTVNSVAIIASVFHERSL